MVCWFPPGGFGAAPAFGGSPGFGSAPAFGGTPSFGSPPSFGGGTTGAQSGFGSAPAFGGSPGVAGGGLFGSASPAASSGAGFAGWVYKSLAMITQTQIIYRQSVHKCVMKDLVCQAGLLYWLVCPALKQLNSRCSKKTEKKKQTKTVNTGQVMFIREIYYYWPFNSSGKNDRIVVKTSFFFA